MVTCAQVKGAQILLRTRPDGFPKMGVSLITFNLLPHATVSLLQGLGCSLPETECDKGRMRTGACKQLTKSPLADAGAVHSLIKQLETYIVEFPLSDHLYSACVRTSAPGIARGAAGSSWTGPTVA